MFSENTNNNTFKTNLQKYTDSNLQGFVKLGFNQTLRGKQVAEKVVIKGRYWKGNWADPCVKTFAVFYK